MEILAGYQCGNLTLTMLFLFVEKVTKALRLGVRVA